MSDRLALANAIEAAGIPRGQAESVATAIARFVEGNAATSADVAAVRADLRDAVQQLTLRGIFGAVSLFFALLGALHYWPPR
jgi:hypothetical protein